MPTFKVLTRFLLIPALMALPSGVLFAAPKDPPPMTPPPMAQSQKIGMYQGRSVEIPLRASGRSLTPLKFLIRTQPKNGRLSAVTMTGNNSAVVTYTHNDKSGPGSDTFTFAVQAVDSPVSAPARITLTVSDEPPALSLVHKLEFNEVFIGETHEEPLVIRNAGGGLLTGKITVPPPWKVIGKSDYALSRRQEITLRVQFSSDEAREYTGQVRFSHDPLLAVDLHGRVSEPLKFSAREIELTATEGNDVRSSALTIQNLTAAEKTFVIDAPPEVSCPSEITIAAGAEGRIPFQTKPGFLGSLESKIVLESDGIRQSFPLRVYSTPANLTIYPADLLDFGTTIAGSQYRKTLKINNDGGAPARLTPQLPPELVLSSDPFGSPIAAGETRSFDVIFEPREIGAFQGSAKFLHSSGALTLPINATVDIGQSAPTTQKKTVPYVTTAPLVPIEAEEKSSDIPKVTDLTFAGSETTHATLTWTQASPLAVHQILEYRTVTPAPGGPPKLEWREFKYLRMTSKGTAFTAILDRMPPRTIWFVRVRAFDRAGRVSEASDTIPIYTTPLRFDGRWLFLVLLFPGGFAAWLLIVRWRKKEAEQEAEENARIRRIEGK